MYLTKKSKNTKLEILNNSLEPKQYKFILKSRIEELSNLVKEFSTEEIQKQAFKLYQL